MNNLPHPDLIIYGGAFDPPHNGHLLCVQLATTRFPHAQLLICPTYAPLRDATSIPKNTMLDFNDRLHLAQIVFTGEQITVSDLEARLPRPTLTANTLQLVRKKFQAQRLALLLGQDQFSSLQDWQRVQEITAHTDIIVARRHDAVSLSESASQLAHTLATTFVWEEQQQRYAAEKFSVYLLASKSLNISSTAIRERLRHKQTLHDVLPSAVVNFFSNNEK